MGPPWQVAALMADFPQPWAIAGGWAIDLFLGHVTRPHQDIEIAIFRDDQRALRQFLAGWRFQQVIPQPGGGVLQPWDDGEWLPLPVHELYATPAGGGPFVLEVLLNERTETAWTFRRVPLVERALAAAVRRSAGGVPYLSPEIVLLYKAKAPRPHDEQDFALTHEKLDGEARLWLQQALEWCHPGHPWLGALKGR